MKRYHFIATLGTLLLTVGLVMMAVMPALAQDEVPEVTVPARPEVLAEYYDAWVNSGHADVTAEAFNHWNEDEEPVVEMNCAQCHSTTGHLDYVGADGSAAWVVDEAPAIGTTVTCDACHNPVSANLSEITFPSGAVITDIGSSARCMTCHQGRASGLTVADQITAAGVEPDVVSEELRFTNIHYYAAASTLYGSEVTSGYEFEGKSYQIRNAHASGINECTDCHNPHTLEVKLDSCVECHDVESAEDLAAIRMAGSLMDYDGDGSTREGILEEIQGLQEILYAAMQAYSAEVVGTPIVYESHSYPYFFVDTDGDGEASEEEANYGNRFATFTPNLAIAAYNYQVTLKDPGDFAHNPKYHIQLLYDTIELLNGSLSEPVDMAMLHRDDAGHFDATAEAFRHWDEEGVVSGRCAKCHAGGIPEFLAEGVNTSTAPVNGMPCTTCHADQSEFNLHVINEVEMPSGMVVSFGEEMPANVCLECHQGRESGPSIQASIDRAGVGADEVTDALRFQNPHYFAAGATLFGADANGAYQFEGKEYNGQFTHARRMETCVDCHDEHALENRIELCSDCHDDVETMDDVRMIRVVDDDVESIDYNGNGDAEEPIRDEVLSMHAALYDALKAYSAEVSAPIVFNAAAYPYWFVDANADGVADEGDTERYAAWTPNLLIGAFNYTYGAKDPGVYAHNADYFMQVAYDTIEALGGDVSSFTRPPVAVAEDD